MADRVDSGQDRTEIRAPALGDFNERLVNPNIPQPLGRRREMRVRDRIAGGGDWVFAGTPQPIACLNLSQAPRGDHHAANEIVTRGRKARAEAKYWRHRIRTDLRVVARCSERSDELAFKRLDWPKRAALDGLIHGVSRWIKDKSAEPFRRNPPLASVAECVEPSPEILWRASHGEWLGCPGLNISQIKAEVPPDAYGASGNQYLVIETQSARAPIHSWWRGGGQVQWRGRAFGSTDECNSVHELDIKPMVENRRYPARSARLDHSGGDRAPSPRLDAETLQVSVEQRVHRAEAPSSLAGDECRQRPSGGVRIVWRDVNAGGF
jgi:hypothetical protein